MTDKWEIKFNGQRTANKEIYGIICIGHTEKTSEGCTCPTMGRNAVRHIKERIYFLKAVRSSDYFNIKYMMGLQIEHILHNFEDHKKINLTIIVLALNR